MPTKGARFKALLQAPEILIMPGVNDLMGMKQVDELERCFVGG